MLQCRQTNPTGQRGQGGRRGDLSSRTAPTGRIRRIRHCFRVDESGNCRPANRSVVSVKAVEKQEDGTAKVTLTEKMKKAYPAGTRSASTCSAVCTLYSAAGNCPGPRRLEDLQRGHQGEAAKGVSSKRGGKHPQTSIVVLANYRAARKMLSCSRMSSWKKFRIISRADRKQAEYQYSAFFCELFFSRREVQVGQPVFCLLRHCVRVVVR